jgi:hypothetical protein
MLYDRIDLASSHLRRAVIYEKLGLASPLDSATGNGAQGSRRFGPEGR